MKKYFLFAFSLLTFSSAFSQTPINPTKIDIVRDSFGVPHIFAKTDAEVAYGLAWAVGSVVLGWWDFSKAAPSVIEEL